MEKGEERSGGWRKVRREERRVKKSEERGAEVVKVGRRGWRKVRREERRVEKGEERGAEGGEK